MGIWRSGAEETFINCNFCNIFHHNLIPGTNLSDLVKKWCSK